MGARKLGAGKLGYKGRHMKLRPFTRTSPVTCLTDSRMLSQEASVLFLLSVREEGVNKSPPENIAPCHNRYC
jgi:hypothetical protein